PSRSLLFCVILLIRAWTDRQTEFPQTDIDQNLRHIYNLKPCSHGVWLGKPRVPTPRGLANLEFPLHVAWQTSSSHGEWLGKSLGSRTEVCQPSIHKHLMSDHLATTNGKLRVTPQSPEQRRFFLLPRRVIKRNANQFDER
ncbi:hypothetical protein AVEN_199497-1, partial [Araneus ventricosus]